MGSAGAAHHDHERERALNVACASSRLRPVVKIVPFMAFTLGQTINLKSVVTAGMAGVVLGVTVVVVTGFVCIVVDRLLGGTGIAGAAASSTAGNSAAVPQAVAIADRSFAPVAEAATVQVAASVIVTAILTPLLTSWWYKRVR